MKKFFSILCVIMMISCSTPKKNVIVTDQASTYISEDYVGDGIVTSIELGWHDRWQTFITSIRDIKTKNVVSFKTKKLIYGIDDTIHVNVIENRINRLNDTTTAIISGEYFENQDNTNPNKYK